MNTKYIKRLGIFHDAVEGWHRRFQAKVGAYHPNFWKGDVTPRIENKKTQ